MRDDVRTRLRICAVILQNSMSPELKVLLCSKIKLRTYLSLTITHKIRIKLQTGKFMFNYSILSCKAVISEEYTIWVYRARFAVHAYSWNQRGIFNIPVS